MLPINKKISAYNHFNSNNIKYIVIHDVGAKSKAKNNVDYFAVETEERQHITLLTIRLFGNQSRISTVLGIVGTDMVSMALPIKIARGIEMCLLIGTVSAKTSNTIELTKHLMAKYSNVEADE